jgi:hypothetical protein
LGQGPKGDHKGKLKTAIQGMKYHHEISQEYHLGKTTYICCSKALTSIHSGNTHDIPLIEVSVEGESTAKHCRKKRRPITCAFNAQEKKAEEKKNPLIKLFFK